PQPPAPKGTPQPSAAPFRTVPASDRAGTRRPAFKPRDGKPAAVPRQADTLAGTVWNAVAVGRGRGLRDTLAPDSPAAALRAAFGTDGIKHAVGIPAPEEMVEYSTCSARDDGGWGATAGTVTTVRAQYPYVLRWYEQGRTLSIVEVLPIPT